MSKKTRSTPPIAIGARERQRLAKKVTKINKGLRRRYPEVHGKVVDFISHAVEDGVLYISVRFKDKTDFSLRYACNLHMVGAEISNVSTGDFEIIRKYIAPILT